FRSQTALKQTQDSKSACETEFWDLQTERASEPSLLIYEINNSERNPLIGHNTSERVAQHCIIPTPTGPTKFNMTFVSSLLASSGALLFAGTVWYITSNAKYELFIWHPTLMALTLLMATF
ncbi:32623_t:CDS:2, partial [Racocetra persica]